MKVKNIFSTAKLWKYMKISVAQSMIAIIACSVSFAHTNHAQVLDREVTLSLDGVSFRQALNELAAAAKVKFAYSIDQFDIHEKISLHAERRPLRDILDELLAPRNIQYKVHEKDATVTLKKSALDPVYRSLNQDDPKQKQLSQPLQITGQITDNTGQPMAGVNILVKGTTTGTTSNSEGNFAIEASPGDILIFSFIGYTSVEISLADQTVINLSMHEDIANLAAVTINAGYYSTTKELQTGTISKIDASTIEKQPVYNTLSALQGRTPGLEIIQQNGIPGGNFKVRVRGTNSLSSGNDPLYIIDGVPYPSTTLSFTETSGNILGGPEGAQGSNPLNNINPSDIESIEILKDADATAIYGSRGANGVILITTRKGKEGKTDIELSFYSGVAKVNNKMNLLNTPQYIQMRSEAFQNDGIPPDPSNAPDLTVWDTNRFTDWQKELIGGNASIIDSRLSISGGDKNTQFLIGGNFHRETTVFPGSNHEERRSLLASISNTSPSQKLRTTLSINASKTFTDILSKDLSFAALTLPPNAPPLYDNEGKLNWDGWTSSFENPLAFLQRKYESNTRNLIANGTISYQLLSHLEAKLSVGITDIHANAVTMYPISSYNPGELVTINQSVFADNDFQNWVAEPQLKWSSSLGDGTIDALAGATFLNQTTQGLAQYAEGFNSESLMKNLGAATSVIPATNFYSQYKYQAFFGRINYTYNEKYVINLTGRRDGSSRFGPGNQFAYFGAIGAAWIFSREGFIRNNASVISFGKLRSSYGTTGNDQIGDYQYLNSYASSGIYQGQKGLRPARLYNPDFAWEINRKFEVSMELGFFNDRILLNTNYYHNRSSNQLVGFPLAPTTGFSSIQGNFPAVVQNTGIECELTTVNIRAADGLEWVTSFNITLPKNKLIEFPNIESSPAFDTRYKVGEPLDIVKLYHHTGVDPTIGEHLFADVDGDDRLDINDRTIVRFTGRKFYGGIHNSIHFKGFQLDFLFQFVKQQGFNHTRLFYNAPGTLSNQPSSVMNRWHVSNPQSNIQRFTTNGTSASEAYSSFYYHSDAAFEDASFVRLKNLSLSYSFNKSLVKKLTLQNISVFIQGQNLLTITNYSGLDPENPGSGSLPPLRTLTAGIKAKI